MGLLSLIGRLFAPTGFDESVVQLSQLDKLVRKLVRGEFEHAFFGLISERTGCVYFVSQDGEFYLDLGVLNETDVPFAEKFRAWATNRDVVLIETSYGNDLESGGKEAPVLRVSAGDSAEELLKLGRSYLLETYTISENQVFDVVP